MYAGEGCAGLLPLAPFPLLGVSHERSLKYLLLYLVAIQIILGYALPLRVVYNYRMDYDVLKNNMAYIDPVLDQVARKIKHERINEYIVTYAGFVAREPGPPIVYWLRRDLERLEPETYGRIREHLESNIDDQGNVGQVESFLRRWVCPKIPLTRYKDYLQSYFWKHVLGLVRPGEKGDTRPWSEKPYLKELLSQPVYQNEFSDRPFVMDDSNLNVFFLNKIIEAQKGSHTLMFLSPANTKLMGDKTGKPGYQENVRRIDGYFQARPVHYINLQEKIDQAMFTDHVHLTAEGYEHLAEILWSEFQAVSPVSAGVIRGEA